ncbi:P-selectin isoform X7 [Esox lucius]|uniref:P-selectin isoform X7 n=1 Tax=Esox lucius TaxID=8010 RepID=UPI00147696B2|nr:P-selectin isoform X7 [Esox lucius]
MKQANVSSFCNLYEMNYWSNYLRPNLNNRFLVILLITINHDLCGDRRRVHAWTYHYSTQNMDWDSASHWCKQHYTDMLAIQNLEEIVYINNMLPKHPQYYWIGIRKVNGLWTWIGTNKTLTKEEENWATGEPNNRGNGQDCVEIYIKRQKDEAKWNDEKCTKKKGAVCYTASCSEHSCSVHADCLENIGSYACQCYPGFKGPRCQEVMQCDTIIAPPHASISCQNPVEKFSYGSTCTVECEEGFFLVGTNSTHCSSVGNWSHSLPTCQVMQCDTIIAPTHASISCQDPVEKFSYGSTCTVECEEGFVLVGTNSTHCSSVGNWSHSLPTCQVMQCDTIIAPTHASISCQDPVEKFSYGSTCTVECEEGFVLVGTNSTHCSSMGNWSHTLPTCQVSQCDTIKAPPHASMKCQDPVERFSYGSTCTIECEEGFVLVGTNSTHCSSMGNWSHSLPTCQVMQCDTIIAPTHASISCQDPVEKFSYGSTCTVECEEGFVLVGTNSTHCSSMGNWSHTLPTCQVSQCDTIKAPPHASMKCQDPVERFSYGSTCTVECEEGFVLVGTNSTHCSSMGNWSHSLPTCQVMQCDTIIAPTHASISCQDPVEKFSYGSTCTVECEEGFVLVGTNSTHCSSMGNWSHSLPTCQVSQCDTIKAPPHASMKCQDPVERFSYGSTCTVECEEGFVLVGTNSTHCSSMGNWSHTLPTCQADQCDVLTNPAHGYVNCSGPHGQFSYSSQCQFSCEQGFLLNGTADTECTSLGTWSIRSPLCEARECPSPVEPRRGWMNCSHPYSSNSYGSQCLLGCSEGFWLTGAPTMHCNASGVWSQDFPSCKESAGMSVGAGMLRYAAVGAASAAGLLLLVGVAILISKKLKKKSDFNLNNSFWEERENPAFEFS